MEGYAVEPEARMPDVAARSLETAGHGRYEMLNFSVAGHSTADE